MGRRGNPHGREANLVCTDLPAVIDSRLALHRRRRSNERPLPHKPGESFRLSVPACGSNHLAGNNWQHRHSPTASFQAIDS
jgi:hypothetical protein